MLADKFRTNTDANKMATKSGLTVNDVPGAKFVHPNIEEHKFATIKMAYMQGSVYLRGNLGRDSARLDIWTDATAESRDTHS